MTSTERLRQTEAEIIRLVRNQIRVQYLPHFEDALREYDEARAPEANPSRRLRRLVRP